MGLIRKITSLRIPSSGSASFRIPSSGSASFSSAKAGQGQSYKMSLSLAQMPEPSPHIYKILWEYAEMPEPPPGFAFTMEKDNPRDNKIILTRKFRGERIKVDVYTPEFHEEDGCDFIWMGVVVHILRANGIEFHMCYKTAMTDHGARVALKIDRVFYRCPSDQVGVRLSIGTESFWEDYIQDRGIDGSTVSFFLRYMTKKKIRDYYLGGGTTVQPPPDQ